MRVSVKASTNKTRDPMIPLVKLGSLYFYFFFWLAIFNIHSNTNKNNWKQTLPITWCVVCRSINRPTISILKQSYKLYSKYLRQQGIIIIIIVCTDREWFDRWLVFFCQSSINHIITRWMIIKIKIKPYHQCVCVE